MNERIQKLFTKACYHGDYEPENVPNDVVEKFAELIIAECIYNAFCNGDDIEYVRKHFGVK